MKYARSDVHRQTHALPVLKFENHALTSFAGLVLFQQLFATLDLKMRLATTPPSRNTSTNRAALWAFEKLDTLRTTILHRAGRFTRPQGILTLTLNANTWARQHFLALLHALKAATPAA